MSKLPVVSGKAAVKAFKKLGYQFDHQTGSHMILRNGVLLPIYLDWTFFTGKTGTQEGREFSFLPLSFGCPTAKKN